MENVVQFKPRSGYEDVMFFASGLDSYNTKKRYLAAIERFIKYQYGIPLKHVRPHHFKDLTYTDMKKYQNYLKGQYKASTVNNEMTAIFSLLKELNRIERDGDYIYSINVERLKVKPVKVDQIDSCGDIEWEEVDEWIKFLDQTNVVNKDRKMAFLHLARLSGLRKDALANLKYRDLVKSNGAWQLKSTLKGKTTTVSLKDKDAEMLLSLWDDQENKDEKILKMSTKTMERLISYILEQFNISPERNISVHSLRGLSIWESYLASGKDVIVSQKHANHSSIETTYGYVKRRTDSMNAVTLYMGKDLDETDQLKELSKDELIELYGKLSRSAKYEIVQLLKQPE